jgi:hypothetical protein
VGCVFGGDFGLWTGWGQGGGERGWDADADAFEVDHGGGCGEVEVDRGDLAGMDGQNPFFERYRLEGTSLVVDNFADGALGKVEGSGAFELKDGEFGKTEGNVRSAAAFITDDAVQFVPAVSGKGNYFRFERQKDGTWKAILEWPATADKPARSKIYVMEPYTAPKQP